MHVISPQFEFQGSSAQDADPSSLKAGLLWKWHPLAHRAGWLSGIRMDDTAAIESNKGFDLVNFTWQNRLVFLTRVAESGPVTIYGKPVIGLDIGGSARHAPGQQDQHSLFRGVVGATATMAFPGGPWFSGITWTTTYTRYQLFHDEFDPAGRLRTGGHTWLDTKLVLKRSPFWAFYAGLQNGNLPPAYTNVSKHISFGLLFKAKFGVE
jgi:hypothetical protein